MDKSCDSIETKVGITEYLSTHKGLFGIIKQRYSDFHVHEISPTGGTAHLTNQDVIPPPSTTEKVIQTPDIITEEKILLFELLSGRRLLKELKPSDLWKIKEKEVEGLALDGLSEIRIDVTGIGKEDRTAVHKYVKSTFPNLNSTTQSAEEKKFILVTKFDKDNNTKRKDSWPKSQCYTTFVLYKENVDTMDAINLLAGKLRMKPGSFCYAGTKDKRGKTSQLVSVYQVSPKNLSEASKGCRGLYVGNFKFRDKPQKLGQLRGNIFKIALRNVEASNDDIQAAADSLKDVGFINYYGLQRFGLIEAPTHMIGKALIQANWKEAIDMILSEKSRDFPNLIEAKKLYFKGDASGAYSALNFRGRTSIEGRLLSGLVEYNCNDLVNALEKIPRNTRLLYIHAYQSFLWNSVLSKRIKKYKLQVLPGDIVRKRLWLERTGKNAPPEGDSMNETSDDLDETTDLTKTVKVLTENEASLFSASEVLLPLPGHNITYPENELREWYEELLNKDGLSIESLKTKVKFYSLGGAYRPIVVRCSSFNWKIGFYDDPNLPLIQSDLEKLQNIPVVDNILEEGKYKAVILEFDLPSSSYATVALRELMKMDMSSKFHTELNTKNIAEKAEENNLEQTKNKRIKLDPNVNE